MQASPTEAAAARAKQDRDFLPDVIRGWLLLQRSGLTEAEKKTVLGSTENALDRTRIVGALKQQWPDHELQAHDLDRKRDRREKRSYFGDAYESDDVDDHEDYEEDAYWNSWGDSEWDWNGYHEGDDNGPPELPHRVRRR